MDGTLIDSNGIWKDVDIAFLKKRGFAYTRAYYEGVAHTIFPLAAKFTKEYCHLSESTEEIMAEWMEMAGDAYATRVPVKPGVQAYLDRCRAAGERMIVLTSSVPAHCRAALGHLGLLPYFETIIFAHDLGIEKKNPEIYHLAARQLGVRESECDPDGAERLFSDISIVSRLLISGIAICYGTGRFFSHRPKTLRTDCHILVNLKDVRAFFTFQVEIYSGLLYNISCVPAFRVQESGHISHFFQPGSTIFKGGKLNEKVPCNDPRARDGSVPRRLRRR